MLPCLLIYLDGQCNIQVTMERNTTFLAPILVHLDTASLVSIPCQYSTCHNIILWSRS